MRTAIILFSLLFLSACAEGRWVSQDLSSFSFQFAAPEPAGPFAKSASGLQAPPQGGPARRAAPEDLAAVTPQ